MTENSRTKKTFINARVNLIFYFLTLLLSFFSRKIFLDILGPDFIGLTSTLQNLLFFLNIVELGIGIAVGYVLYKPLYNQDRQTINEIISVFGYLYRWIGIIILTAGIILSLFLPLIFKNTTIDFPIIYLTFYAFLASSLIGYFINYRQTLLSADQKNYVVTAYYQTGYILKIIVQMISACYTGSYYLWIAIEFIFGIIYSFILNWKINIVYPWLNDEIKNGKELLKKYPEIIKLTKQVFIHKIAGVVQFQITPFLVYAFVSLQTVAFYGNYTIITEKLTLLLRNVLDSTSAGIGNLIAEGKKDKILNVYWELMAIRFLFAGIVIFSLYNILPQFINLWLGEEYILSNRILFCVLTIFGLNLIRGTTDQFISGYGLFSDVYSPVIEIIIFFVIALPFGHFFGLEGLLSGSICSTFLVIYCWKPYFLFSKGFKMSIWKYWYTLIKYIILTSISFYISSFLFKLIKEQISLSNIDWISFILSSIVITLIISFIHFIILYIGSNGMKLFIKRIINYKS